MRRRFYGFNNRFRTTKFNNRFRTTKNQVK